MPQQTIMLQQFGSDNMVYILDSVHSDTFGNFELTAFSPEPGLYRLQFRDKKNILLSIDKGTVKLSGDWSNIQNYTLSGSDPSLQLKDFIGSIRNFIRDQNTISRVIDTMKARGNDSLLALAVKEQEDISVKYTQFVEHYADSTAYLPNAVFAAKLLNSMTEITFLDALSQNLMHRFPNAKMSKDFAAYCFNNTNKQEKLKKQATNLQTGMQAPPLIISGMDGVPIALSSTKGKYTFINFWASWNNVSLIELPYIIAAYEKYKNDNFVVYNISLDNKKEDWIKAIAYYHTNFIEVSDLKGMHSDAATTYNVNTLPANFLLDTSGKVIAKNLRNTELEGILSRVSGK